MRSVTWTRTVTLWRRATLPSTACAVSLAVSLYRPPARLDRLDRLDRLAPLAQLAQLTRLAPLVPQVTRILVTAPRAGLWSSGMTNPNPI